MIRVAVRWVKTCQLSVCLQSWLEGEGGHKITAVITALCLTQMQTSCQNGHHACIFPPCLCSASQTGNEKEEVKQKKKTIYV